MKILKKFLLLIFIFAILFANAGINSNAEGNYTLEIDLSSIGEEKDDIILEIWKIDDKMLVDKEKTYKALSKKSIKELNNNNNYHKIGEAKSDWKKVRFIGLDKGTYYVIDPEDPMRVAPILLSLPRDIADGSNLLTVKAKKNHSQVILIKKDESSHKPLANAEFKILDKDKKALKKFKDKIFKTDETGKIIFNDLEYGKYVFQEVKAPDGYMIVNEFTKCIVNSNEVEITITNKKSKGSYYFVKVNDRKEPLEGAVFEVVSKKDNKKFKVESSRDGKFKVEDMDFGQYYLLEVKAPKGYILLSEPINFEIGENNQNGSIPVKFITNTKKGKGGRIPKAGDIKPMLLIASGSILFALGKYIIQKENKISK